MAQKKETEKKDVKVQDLAPKKDAKGGAARNLDGGRALDGGRSLDGARSLDAARSQDGASTKNLS